MNMDASVTASKPAPVRRFLCAVWRHALIDLFLVEILAAVFLVTRLPVPVRPVRLDAADFSTLVIRETAGTWPAQSLTLYEQEEIAEYCELFNGLRAPRERHPARYQTLGGSSYEFAFTREDGEAFTVGVTSGTPLFFVKETPESAPQYYHVGGDAAESLCAAMYPVISSDD